MLKGRQRMQNEHVFLFILPCYFVILPILVYYRLNLNNFVESIRILLKNNAPNEDFQAFHELMLNENVCLTIQSD